MLQLFMSSDDTNYPIKYYPRMDYIKRRMGIELSRIQNYYFYREGGVNNSHLISRLIHMLYENYETDPLALFRRLNYTKEYIARQMKIVSDISFGEVHNNIFYNGNSKEILISVDNFIDPFEMREHWREFVPIRVVYTDEVDLDFYQFDGTKTKSRESLTVVEIDITILVMMYNYWSLERLKNNQSTNTNYFTKMIVLPKMMGSMLDLTIWNRFMGIFYNSDLNTSYSVRHPIHMINMHNEIDNILRNVVRDVEDKSIVFNALIESVPTIYNYKMNNALQLNRDGFTRQSEWTIWASRIDYIDFLIDIAGKRGFSRNTTDIYKLPQYIRLLRNNSTPIFDMLSGDILKRFNFTLDKLESKIGKR